MIRQEGLGVPLTFLPATSIIDTGKLVIQPGWQLQKIPPFLGGEPYSLLDAAF